MNLLGFSNGVFPDILIHKGVTYLAYTEYSPAGSCIGLVVVSWKTDTFVETIYTDYDVRTHGYPRFGVNANDEPFVAYRKDYPYEKIVTYNLVTKMIENLLACGGNDPVCTGSSSQIAINTYDGLNFNVYKGTYETEIDTFARLGAGTGLSRFLNNEVRLVDEDRLIIPGMTRPCWAGDLIVGEGPDVGVIGDLLGKRIIFWEGEQRFTPRASVEDGVYAITAWSPGGQIQVWDNVTEVDFTEEVKPPQPELKKPEVTVDSWTLDTMKNGREFIFHDRENPDLDYRIRVWIENGSMYAEISNKAGSGRTGSYRKVILT